MTHKDDGDIGESWQQPGNLEDVYKLVEGWSPDIVAAVHKMKECLDWKICYRDPLPTWVSRSGKVALIGDSAHPHLPTSAQGASQTTEDGAVLALCLTFAGKGNVPLATRTFERLRYQRVRNAQLCGEDVRDRWHNALKQVNHGEHIDPESLHMRVSKIPKIYLTLECMALSPRCGIRYTKTMGGCFSASCKGNGGENRLVDKITRSSHSSQIKP